MPTLQAADINHFETTVKSSVQAATSNVQTETGATAGWTSKVARLRGYCALGALVVITLSGYAALFVLFDRYVAMGVAG